MMDAVGKCSLRKHDDNVEEKKNKSKSSTKKRKIDDVGTSILYVVANIKKKRKMNNTSKQEEEDKEMSKLYSKSSKRKRNYTISYVLNRKKRREKLNSMPMHEKKLNNDVYKAIRYLRNRKINTSISINKKRKMMNDTEEMSKYYKKYLSEDVIFDILSSTCVTSLLRCKSVCKLWESVISKPEFMNAHHLNSVSKLPSVMMITSSINDDVSYHATIVYSNSPSVNIPIVPPFDNLEFVNSFNGVVCVFNKAFGDIYLLNPLTRSFKKLALPPAVATVPRRKRMIFRGPFSDSKDCSPTVVSDNTPPLLKVRRVDIGFGFDCVSSEFKVLFIEYRKTDLTHVDLAAVNLYSSSSDSWRSIDISIDLPSLLCYPFCPFLRSGPVVDGVLYMEGADAIVTFDLHNEQFGLILYPGFIHTRKSNILDFEGSVAVVLETGSLVEKELSLWKLVALSDEVVWKKMFTFDSTLEEIDWLFLYSGENLFFGKTRLGEMLYDYRKKHTKYVGLPSQSFLVRVFSHTESFLSVEGFAGVVDLG